jgi:hypothetical protein
VGSWHGGWRRREAVECRRTNVISEDIGTFERRRGGQGAHWKGSTKVHLYTTPLRSASLNTQNRKERGTGADLVHAAPRSPAFLLFPHESEVAREREEESSRKAVAVNGCDRDERESEESEHDGVVDVCGPIQ